MTERREVKCRQRRIKEAGAGQQRKELENSPLKKSSNTVITTHFTQ